MKLTDVARASLSELRGDYEIWILDRGQLPWSVHSPEAKSVNAISLDPASFTDDMVHESARHAREQRKSGLDRQHLRGRCGADGDPREPRQVHRDLERARRQLHGLPGRRHAAGQPAGWVE